MHATVTFRVQTTPNLSSWLVSVLVLHRAVLSSNTTHGALTKLQSQPNILLFRFSSPTPRIPLWRGTSITKAGLAFSRDGPKKVYIQRKMLEDARSSADMLTIGVACSVRVSLGPSQTSTRPWWVHWPRTKHNQRIGWRVSRVLEGRGTLCARQLQWCLLQIGRAHV